jgi:hypothetical protein
MFQCILISIRPLRVEEFLEVSVIHFGRIAPLTFHEGLRPLDAEEACYPHPPVSSLLSIGRVSKWCAILRLLCQSY